MSRYGKISFGTAKASTKSVREIPMKQTLKQRFKNWLMRDDNEELISVVGADEGPSLHSEDSLRFNIYRASGGMIIETRKYDRIKDINHTRLHIVVDGEDLGSSIGKIITMEALR
jgi:hypothetical protein